MEDQNMQPFEFKMLGGFKSPEDYRDVDLASVAPPPTEFPDSFFVDVSMLPVWMQNQIGACTGHAGAKYLQKLKYDESNTLTNLSARFPYAIAKCLDKIDGEGTFPRLIAQIFQKYGCATEATMPNNTLLDHETYVYHRNLKAIPQAAYNEAAQHKIKSYAFPGVTAEGLQNAIINSKGCMLLMEVGPTWWTAMDGHVTWQAPDILPLRQPKNITGGHELYLYGYDHVNGRLRFWVFNCWSANWAENGMGYFYYTDQQPDIIESITFVDLPDDLLNHLKELPAPNTFTHNFTKPIQYGNTGDEVKALQTALYMDGELKVDPSQFGTYGPKTQAAVKAFQTKYQVATPAEINAVNGTSVGPLTRAKLNSLFNK